jgi:hypothetical protein
MQYFLSYCLDISLIIDLFLIITFNFHRIRVIPPFLDPTLGQILVFTSILNLSHAPIQNFSKFQKKDLFQFTLIIGHNINRGDIE